jgi:hypothetical protein
MPKFIPARNCNCSNKGQPTSRCSFDKDALNCLMSVSRNEVRIIATYATYLATFWTARVQSCTYRSLPRSRAPGTKVFSAEGERYSLLVLVLRFLQLTVNLPVREGQCPPGPGDTQGLELKDRGLVLFHIFRRDSLSQEALTLTTTHIHHARICRFKLLGQQTTGSASLRYQ